MGNVWVRVRCDENSGDYGYTLRGVLCMSLKGVSSKTHQGYNGVRRYFRNEPLKEGEERLFNI